MEISGTICHKAGNNRYKCIEHRVGGELVGNSKGCDHEFPALALDNST